MTSVGLMTVLLLCSPNIWASEEITNNHLPIGGGTGETEAVENYNRPNIFPFNPHPRWNLMESAYGREVYANYAAARARRDIMELLENPMWDDGSLAPVVIRLAWHSSSTYNAATRTGGTNGACMRFPFGKEAKDQNNVGIETARAFLEIVKKKNPDMSYSDLWVLAAYVSLEVTGGPKIQFHPGRIDITDESACPPIGPLQTSETHEDGVDEMGRQDGWQDLATYMRDTIFGGLGLNDQEIVALLCGGHTYGRCHSSKSGFAGPWLANPTKWSNDFARETVDSGQWHFVSHNDTWLKHIGADDLLPAQGLHQYVNIKKPGEGGCPFQTNAGGQDRASGCSASGHNLMRLTSDMVLAWDKGFRKHLVMYAMDEELLKRDFGAAFKKITELGCPWVSE